jgi:predicted permease
MFWRRRQRLDEELEHHLAAETAENIARGMSPVAAASAARRATGNLASVKERAREVDPLYWLDTFSQDVQFAFRLIGRNRWVSVGIIATLTLGIALNVSVFSVLNALLLKPWVSDHPETFVSLIPRYSGEYRLRFSDSGSLSQPDYVRYRDQAKSLQALAALRLTGVTLTGPESGTLRAALLSCNTFDVIRPGAPILGRYFSAGECDRIGEAPVAVLSESTWRVRFKADRGVIGRTLFLNRLPFTIIGVVPNYSLFGPNSDGEVSVPYTMQSALRPTDGYFADAHAHWLTVVGRRRPEYSLTQVQEELKQLSALADAAVPGRRTSLLVTDGSLVQNPDVRERAPLIFAVTLGTTGLLLLLACVNVTTLLLARAAARQREIAVRLTVGAGRLRLLRQLLTEGLVLSSIAAALSVLIAQRAPAALWYSLVGQAAPFDLTPDFAVLLYCLGIALTAGIIASLSPALASLRPHLAESLKASGGGATAGQRKFHLHGLLVSVQVALSLLLLVQAGLITRAQRQFFSYHPGFETKQIVGVTLASVLTGFQPTSGFYQELDTRVRAIPGVVGVTYVSIAPWSGRNSTTISEVDGQNVKSTNDFRQDPARRLVSPDYFATLDLPLVRGRTFTRTEAASEVIPTVISEAMAKRYWPGQNPLGQRFRAAALHEVVGIARDVQSIAFMRDDGPLYYAPLATERANAPYLLVRVSGDPSLAASTLRELVRQLDPQMATTVTPLAALIQAQGERLKPVVMHGLAAGILALILALTGVYGVVAFSVSQRVREIGIRLALGAQRRDVIWLVLRSAATPVCGGLIAGLAIAFALFTGIESLLFGVSPRDPFTLTTVPALLLLAALAASWLPARRAAALDPLSSLRSE